MTSRELAGKTIKEIFRHSEEIAGLHACLTSPRGDYFRFRLLQAMEVPLHEAAIERLREKSNVAEFHRHLHRLLSFGLIREQVVDGENRYVRTDMAEKAINVVREFERRATRQAATAVYAASLGPNSIRFFLQIYGHKTNEGWEHIHFGYTPAEMGRLSLFLSRPIERISAVDKLNEADLLVYREDNHIYIQATKARSFYQYLRDLYAILKANRHRSNSYLPT